jgi:hypothetical protein
MAKAGRIDGGQFTTLKRGASTMDFSLKRDASHKPFAKA